MPRSGYVYLVQDDAGTYAAFTVKHECVRYVKKLCPDGIPDFIRVRRFRDGHAATSEDITREFVELLQSPVKTA